MVHTFFVECEINGQWVDAGSAAQLEGAVSIANVAVKYYNVPTRILGEEGSIPLVQLNPGEILN
jgi:hypothetical protein